MRLISLTCVPSDPTPSIWWSDVDRGVPGRGEALRFILVNLWHRGSTMRSSWRACSSYSECRHSQRHTTTILSTQLNNKKTGARRRSWALGSTIRRVVHNDDLEHPTHEQEVWHMMTIGFEIPRSLKNSATTFQAVARQSATTDPIDGPTRPPIRTSSMTTRSSGLALTEIRTMKPQE
jgi:hypothetical protein